LSGSTGSQVASADKAKPKTRDASNGYLGRANRFCVKFPCSGRKAEMIPCPREIIPCTAA
jgi:hypothetical protein